MAKHAQRTHHHTVGLRLNYRYRDMRCLGAAAQFSPGAATTECAAAATSVKGHAASSHRGGRRGAVVVGRIGFREAPPYTTKLARRRKFHRKAPKTR